MRDWALKNREAFERDVLRDFCLASVELTDQFARLASARTVSFPVLRALVGEPLNKGLLWRLKDKAHHVYLGRDGARPCELLLDWALGYIFHETLKLMEDAHQRQFYAPRLVDLSREGLDEDAAAVAAAFSIIQEQTCESMRREATRLSTLLDHVRKLFCQCFAGQAGHRPLARFLHDNNELVRQIFGADYALLERSVYGDAPERMHVEAAVSLLQSARTEQAALALHEALTRNPHCPEALDLLRRHKLAG